MNINAEKFMAGDIEIIPVEYGKSVLPEDSIFEDGVKENVRPIVFMVYLIKAADKLILADAGCETMPGFNMRDFIGTRAALEKIGVTTVDITDLAITHAHHDHIECARYFKNARVFIQHDEYEAGKDNFSEDTELHFFDDEIQICDAVKMIKIGGHSIGSSIIEITGRDKKYIIAGDECYLRECLERKMPTGTSHCPAASRAFIEKYAGNDEYKVLLCHDK